MKNIVNLAAFRVAQAARKQAVFNQLFGSLPSESYVLPSGGMGAVAPMATAAFARHDVNSRAGTQTTSPPASRLEKQ
jgi:hypothetical protein